MTLWTAWVTNLLRLTRHVSSDDSKAHDIARGVVGIGAPLAGVTVANLALWEVWLRMTSLMVGIMVGLATLVSLSFSIYRKWKRRHDWGEPTDYP